VQDSTQGAQDSDARHHHRHGRRLAAWRRLFDWLTHL
jgi:hypothetical protein